MARPKDQPVHEQGAPTHQDSGADQAARAGRRIREAIEDDNAREALKSLHELESRRPKAG
jgi:hypothetical protein